jgi:signal transduction histidine kinase
VPRNVPLRRSLLVRMLATSVLIALCSIAATAWLAVQSTTKAIQQAQGQALANDAKIYDALVGYAATHRDWGEAGPTVQKLAARTGRQITLTTTDRVPILRSSTVPKTQPLPQKESAVVDPLHTDPDLQPGVDVRIDPRVKGPYRLSLVDREKQQIIAGKVVSCLTENAQKFGRPNAFQDLAGYAYVNLSGNWQADLYLEKFDKYCGVDQLARPAATERRLLGQLTRYLDACLDRKKRGPVKVIIIPLDRQYMPSQRLYGDQEVQDCLDTGRRRQLRPYVAPAALLFIRTSEGVSSSRFNLSRSNITKIAGAAALVLLVTITVTVLVGARLVRPLRALTAAATHPTEANARVPVNGHDEIAVLATALNKLSERREQADAQRTAMVSDVAHELRTPLTNIRSWLEAAEDGLATPASDPALAGALLREALQLQHIIDDLQDLAVAEATGLRLSPEAIPVAELLTQVITAHRGKAETRDVTLTAHAPGNLQVSADPVRLRQALGNLVSNAIRYTPAHGTVSVVGREDADEIIISVVDDGTGINEEDLPHVFDRFWRADRSRSRATGGSGLGLAIVRQIAQAHGGSVSVASSHGKGSSFTLHLPNRQPVPEPPVT